MIKILCFALLLGSAQAIPTDNILKLIADDPYLTVFNKFLNASGLSRRGSILDGPGPFTIFAFNDEAAAEISPEAMKHILDPANVKEVVELVTHHIVGGNYHLEDFKNHEALATFDEMSEVFIHIANETHGSETREEYYVDHAQIVHDIQKDATNGVLMPISGILIPHSDATYKCDETTKRCEPDRHSPEDQRECEHTCGHSGELFTCDHDKHQCVADAHGHEDKHECENSCGTFVCNNATKRCEPSDAGTMNGWQCEHTCGGPTPTRTMYACNKLTKTCNPDKTATTDHYECEQACGAAPTALYKCDTATKKCVADEHGTESQHRCEFSCGSSP